jgi:low affinity Fe/Cu permease
MIAYKDIEDSFEKMANTTNRWLGSAAVFIAAVALTITWFLVRDWDHIIVADIIRDAILAVTFLTFFMIQRSAIHFSQALHLKLNELVVAQENARNHIIKAEEKTGAEIAELAKEHDRIVEEEQQTKSE